MDYSIFFLALLARDVASHVKLSSGGAFMNKEWMSIGELAKLMKVSVRTLQYYDKQGLLSPSAFSEGGRRLYHANDVVKLHQILSFKYFGFSLEEIRDHILPLNTPDEIVQALHQQKEVISQQVKQLQEALTALDALSKEVQQMPEVDFKKYAEIIQLLRMDNKEYWVWKLMDTELTTHIKQRFTDHPELAEHIMKTYHRLVYDIVIMMEQSESPTCEHAMNVAKEWMDMVNDFTGGDYSLISKLQEFNQHREGWDEELAKKQEYINSYLETMLEAYADLLMKEN